ncbi:2-hydroxyacid dehydrogenase [Pandoraea apista]|uniref:Glyoxylate reductase n=1 Tax=Pandoraea apista TaxID=93218 RepID=A0A0G4JFB4_9BURK|nr:glyoxylate/hydroxypyruvate reductase A [Pandoraea apista]ALS65946.1 glyoxylate/hydroxypyruvate reductase A [Pandoraea apista]OXS95518.1 glyoxylate/hydroxypyruvate reductase A [Pandoraea apista]PTE02518.1 glyoxylate/hydroxypyruvate reductase A [Pandoraea apista]RRJ34942.1 glyoxylate/hydroxypyruvate reductase A [Pandoraea apista]RRJ81978.1 glyoxylate/hydroxypyruvate reductase A [Pandoraea apista]
MDILIFSPDGKTAPYETGLAGHLPQASIRSWQPGDSAPADYLVLWKPNAEVLQPRERLKAIFNMGAGVDGVLGTRGEGAQRLPAGVPLVRLEDAGMADQMAQYVSAAALRYFRRLDVFHDQQAQAQWKFQKPNRLADFPVAVLGYGTLGAHVAKTLKMFGFPVRAWSRSQRSEGSDSGGVALYHGAAGFDACVSGARILVNLLPLTPETVDVLNASLFAKLAQGAFLINVARGAHLVEADLLAALESAQIAGATLDVFRTEPLPADHPFWREPRITVTPHISALTLRDETVAQIAGKIAALERGEAITGIVDLTRGY